MKGKTWTVQTRKSTLLECLKYLDGIRLSASKGGHGLEAIRGFEDQFEEYSQKCETLREIIKAFEDEDVRRAFSRWTIDQYLPEDAVKRRKRKEKQMREWQMKIMQEDAEGTRGHLWEDEDPGPEVPGVKSDAEETNHAYSL